METTTNNTTTGTMVSSSLQSIGYTFTPHGWQIHIGGMLQAEPISIMTARVRNHLEEIKSKHVPSKDAMVSAIELLEHNKRVQYSEQCFENLKHRSGTIDESQKLALLFAGENYHEIYPSIIRQLVWSVKAKWLGNKVTCPILAIFFGSAGVGKSTLLRHLYAPLPNYRCSFIKDGDSLINKEKNTQLIADSLILHLDEMSGMTKADIAKLKALDAPYLSYVPHYTNTPRTMFNHATIIGCSNTQVRNLLHSTGNNRKWVQLNFYQPPDEGREAFIRERINALQAFDYITLWRSVDENGPEPFSDEKVYDGFRRYVEDTCTSSTPTTDWLEEFIVNHAGQWVNKFGVFKEYQERCKTETKHMSKDNFYELCQHRGFKDKRNAVGDRGFQVPEIKKEEVF